MALVEPSLPSPAIWDIIAEAVDIVQQGCAFLIVPALIPDL